MSVIKASSQMYEVITARPTSGYFVAFTDGGCRQTNQDNCHGMGGWAVVVLGPRGEKWELRGDIRETTSNRAEVCALLAAIATVPERSALGIQSDSQYVVDRVRAGCRSSDNTDLWCEVRELLVAKDIRLNASWVPGHSGYRHNERVDKLASAFCRNDRRSRRSSRARYSRR